MMEKEPADMLKGHLALLIPLFKVRKIHGVLKVT